jgi:hypothetical protein
VAEYVAPVAVVAVETIAGFVPSVVFSEGKLYVLSFCFR